MKKFLPYIIAITAVFNLLPFISKDLGIFILMLIVINPLTSFICAFIYGIKKGFSFWLAIICAIGFIPAMFIHYNVSAWVYIIMYIVFEFAGNGIGTIIRKNKIDKGKLK